MQLLRTFDAIRCHIQQVGSSFGDSYELRAGADAEPRGCLNNIYFRVFQSLCMHMDVKAPFGPVPYSGDAQPSVRMIEAEAEVRPMKLVHVPAGVNTLDAAFDDDPCMHYVRKTPDARPRIDNITFRAMNTTQLAVNIFSRNINTVDGGDALVQFRPPGPSKPLHKVLGKLIERFPPFRSPEQRKRGKELDTKLAQAVKSAFGENTEDMFAVQLLATHPRAQGRGYGAALVASVTAKADADNRRTWLVSSNVANTWFYEHCGFTTVAEFAVGEGNPTWTKPPVIVRVMAREPQSRE